MKTQHVSISTPPPPLRAHPISSSPPISERIIIGEDEVDDFGKTVNNILQCKQNLTRHMNGKNDNLYPRRPRRSSPGWTTFFGQNSRRKKIRTCEYTPVSSVHFRTALRILLLTGQKNFFLIFCARRTQDLKVAFVRSYTNECIGYTSPPYWGNLMVNLI